MTRSGRREADRRRTECAWPARGRIGARERSSGLIRIGVEACDQFLQRLTMLLDFQGILFFERGLERSDQPVEMVTIPQRQVPVEPLGPLERQAVDFIVARVAL